MRSWRSRTVDAENGHEAKIADFSLDLASDHGATYNSFIVRTSAIPVPGSAEPAAAYPRAIEWLAAVIKEARRRQRRRRLLSAAALVLAVAVALSLYLELSPSSEAPASALSPPLARTAFDLNAPAVALTAARGSVWAVVEGSKMQALLWKIDPRNGKRLNSFTIGRTGPDFGAVTSSGSVLWAAAGTTVLRVDIAHPARITRAPLPGEAATVAVAFGSVWVATIGERGYFLVRLDAHTLARQARIHLDVQPTAISSGLGSLWLASLSSLQRIDPRTNRAVATPAQPDNPIALTITGNRLWVLQRSGAVTLVDRLGKQRALIPLPFPPSSFAVAGDRIWVTNNCGCKTGVLAVIDRTTQRVREITLGTTPVALTTIGNEAWVATFGDAKLWGVRWHR